MNSYEFTIWMSLSKGYLWNFLLTLGCKRKIGRKSLMCEKDPWICGPNQSVKEQSFCMLVAKHGKCIVADLL